MLLELKSVYYSSHFKIYRLLEMTNDFLNGLQLEMESKNTTTDSDCY